MSTVEASPARRSQEVIDLYSTAKSRREGEWLFQRRYQFVFLGYANATLDDSALVRPRPRIVRLRPQIWTAMKVALSFGFEVQGALGCPTYMMVKCT